MKSRNKGKGLFLFKLKITFQFVDLFRKIEKIIEKFTNKEKTDNFLSILNIPDLLSKANEKRRSSRQIKKTLTPSTPTKNELKLLDNSKGKPIKNDQFEFMMDENELEEFSSNNSKKIKS